MSYTKQNIQSRLPSELVFKTLRLLSLRDIAEWCKEGSENKLDKCTQDPKLRKTIQDIVEKFASQLNSEDEDKIEELLDFCESFGINFCNSVPRVSKFLDEVAFYSPKDKVGEEEDEEEEEEEDPIELGRSFLSWAIKDPRRLVPFLTTITENKFPYYQVPNVIPAFFIGTDAMFDESFMQALGEFIWNKLESKEKVYVPSLFQNRDIVIAFAETWNEFIKDTLPEILAENKRSAAILQEKKHL